jgi:hypothetical protein
MNKSCSIFFYEGWLGIAPTVINLATTLAKIGYTVIIFARKQSDFIHPNNLDEKIIVVELQQPKIVLDLNNILFRLKLGSITYFISLIAFGIQAFLWNFKQDKEQLNRQISVGVDTNGSIIAWIESWILKSRLVYLSLELTVESRFGKIDKIRLFLEHFSFKKSSCVLIQDEDRFKHLCAQNKYQHPQVFYLPNTVISNITVSHNNYFREIFKLSEEKYPYLVTHAGMLSDDVCAEEVVTAFNDISSKFALIYHTSKKSSLDEPYIKFLREINSRNLFLSLNPLPYEEIYQVFDASNIGLVFYKEVDENFTNIAKASGKLSAYLQHGKPVIMSNLESLVEFNNKYNFGRVIQDITSSKEFESILEDILANYDFYSQNAKKCFEKEFMFDGKIEPFLKFMCSESFSLT